MRIMFAPAALIMTIFGVVQAKNQTECARYFNLEIKNNASADAEVGGTYFLTAEEFKGEPVYERADGNKCAVFERTDTLPTAILFNDCNDLGNKAVTMLSGPIQSSCWDYDMASTMFRAYPIPGTFNSFSTNFATATASCPECRTASGNGELAGDYFLKDVYLSDCEDVDGSDYCSYTNSANETFCFAENNGTYAIDFTSCL